MYLNDRINEQDYIGALTKYSNDLLGDIYSVNAKGSWRIN